jgi:penicillin amidase
MATLEEWLDAGAAAVPPLTGEVLLPGLSAPVLLLRDGLVSRTCVPPRARDAFLAQGLRPRAGPAVQMELNRRRALGRSAEWLGPSAFAADAWRAGSRRGGEPAGRRGARREAREMVEAYAAGANAVPRLGAPLPRSTSCWAPRPSPGKAGTASR